MDLSVLSAVHFIVTADVTSLKPRLHFYSNRQSSFSGFLSMPKNQCRTLNVGLQVRHCNWRPVAMDTATCWHWNQSQQVAVAMTTATVLDTVTLTMNVASCHQSPVRDQVRPLWFSLNASLYEKIPKRRGTFQDLRHLPVLSQTPQPITTQVRTWQIPQFWTDKFHVELHKFGLLHQFLHWCQTFLSTRSTSKRPVDLIMLATVTYRWRPISQMRTRDPTPRE